MLVVLSTCCTLVAQLLLKRVVNSDGARGAMSEGPLQFIMHAAMVPTTSIALAIQVAGYITWLFVLSREKMAVAFAISGSFFYIVTALASWFLYSETLAPSQWAGLTLISIGVFMVIPH